MKPPNDSVTTPTMRLIDWAWGIAGATAIIAAITAVGAIVSIAPGDRAGGIRIGALLGLGLCAAALARFRAGVVGWMLVAMGLGQCALGVLLAWQGIGAPRVVATITAIFATGWLVAGVLMLVAHRQRRRGTVA